MSEGENGVPGREDRKECRYEVEGEVHLRVLFTKTANLKEVRARLRNFGPGGIYVETSEEIPKGALADLDLRLEGRPLANALGLVRWHKPGEGVGIEFFYGTDEDRLALEAYLAAWLRERQQRN